MNSFSTEAWTFLALGIVTILIRTYARWRLVRWKGLWIDDYLMLLVIIPYAIETTLAHIVATSAHGLANSGMTDEERAGLSPDSDEYRWRSAI